MKVTDMARKCGISEAALHKWKTKFGRSEELAETKKIATEQKGIAPCIKMRFNGV